MWVSLVEIFIRGGIDNIVVSLCNYIRFLELDWNINVFINFLILNFCVLM